MQLIVVSCLIAILASVSADCDVGKTVQDFDFNKVSSDMTVCRECGSRQCYGSLSLSSVVYFQVEYFA